MNFVLAVVNVVVVAIVVVVDVVVEFDGNVVV